MLTVVLVIAVIGVAFTNGANANFKGVASLYGSGTTSLRQALIWGTIATFLGSLSAGILASELIASFSGKGIVPDTLVQNPRFATSVAAGAALTSFLATRFGFPVSTTHALVGALLGAGWMASGSEVKLATLGKLFLFPLFFSPAIAIVFGSFTYLALRRLGLAPDHRTRTLDALHLLSAGAASFARGLNDTPKMAALVLLVPNLAGQISILIIGIVIALGGLIDGRRVAETLGKKITEMDPGQGFSANLVTAMLVTTASLHGLPVSTTHVSVGALVGMGASSKRAHWRKIGEIGLAWAITLPCGAILAALTFLWLPS